MERENDNKNYGFLSSYIVEYKSYENSNIS